MSDLAKDLLTRYYGLGAETRGLRFLSVHQSVENARKEEEKDFTEQIPTAINEDIASDLEFDKDVGDEQKLTSRNESTLRPSNIVDDFSDEYDTDKQLDTLNIDFVPNILYDNIGNPPSTLREESYREIAQNTARSTIENYVETERNDERDGIENDLKPIVIEESILDTFSEDSFKVEKKSRVPSICSSKSSIHLPPLEPKKSPVCNETFADFSHTNLKEFPAEILIDFRHLRMLYLSNNELTKIPDEVFTTLKYLEWFDARNNQLTSLPTAINWHPCLETILLQGNKLESLPLELCTLPNLHTFQVTQNPLVSPPEDIVASGSAAILDYLRLEWNKTYPDKRIEPKKNRIEPKLSTILCYQSPRKIKKKLAPLKDSYHHKIISTRERRKLYRPSNRYSDDKAIYYNNISYSLGNIYKALRATNLQTTIEPKFGKLLENFRRKGKHSVGKTLRDFPSTAYNDKEIDRVANQFSRMTTCSSGSSSLKNYARIRNTDREAVVNSKIYKNMNSINNTGNVGRVFDIITNDGKRFKMNPMKLKDSNWILSFLENYLGISK